MPKKLQPCGTAAAYERHRYRNEPICKSCMTARTTYTREQQRRSSQLRSMRRSPQPTSDRCGTEGGYRVHARQFTPPCEPCVKGHEEFVKEQSINRAAFVSPFTKKACEEVWKNAIAYFDHINTLY